MRLGIFAKTFVRPSVEQVWEAVASHGLHAVQFNMACAGMSSMPEAADLEVAARVKAEADKRHIAISAVSGTFNMAHPDPGARREGLRRLETLMGMCSALGTGVITLCTGSRDPGNMWRRHPDNDTEEAWNDFLRCLAEALELAERYRVTLAVEPEAANVVSNATRARRLLDIMRSDRLKIVMDAANLLSSGDLAKANMRKVMDEAFELLGEHIVIAHAKDIAGTGEDGFVAAGQGVLDYDHYISLLQQSSFRGEIILHGLDEPQVPDSIRFMRLKLGR